MASGLVFVLTELQYSILQILMTNLQMLNILLKYTCLFDS